jgi:hypothetical protein
MFNLRTRAASAARAASFKRATRKLSWRSGPKVISGMWAGSVLINALAFNNAQDVAGRFSHSFARQSPWISQLAWEVAKFARVCSYDRAGYGWTEAGPKPRTSLQIAKELRALLDASGEKGTIRNGWTLVRWV